MGGRVIIPPIFSLLSLPLPKAVAVAKEAVRIVNNILPGLTIGDSRKYYKDYHNNHDEYRTPCIIAHSFSLFLFFYCNTGGSAAMQRRHILPTIQ